MNPPLALLLAQSDDEKAALAIGAAVAGVLVVFALIAVRHLWHGLAERHRLATEPGSFLAEAALGVVAATLSVWAWGLLRRQSRRPSSG